MHSSVSEFTFYRRARDRETAAFAGQCSPQSRAIDALDAEHSFVPLIDEPARRDDISPLFRARTSKGLA